MPSCFSLETKRYVRFRVEAHLCYMLGAHSADEALIFRPLAVH